jgi:hypothetical protein
LNQRKDFSIVGSDGTFHHGSSRFGQTLPKNAPIEANPDEQLRTTEMTNPFQQISPLRNTTTATVPKALAEEQLHHFGIDPTTKYGHALRRLAEVLYEANAATVDLWKITFDTLETLDRSDRIAYFNAKRFVCFQLAKVLDSLQNPMRRTYQSIMTDEPGFACKGPYPIFDNVTAIFSATPVITRTATYLYACLEWVEDAFKGREPLHEIYSRLLNPTSISLANHIVDIECGPRAHEYMAWNFNSGMAAIDGLFSHLLGVRDIVLSSRNVYGGTYQLLEDWFGKASNLDVAIEWFDGFDATAFEDALDSVESKYADRIEDGRRIYVFLESPSNPHGNVVQRRRCAGDLKNRAWAGLAGRGRYHRRHALPAPGAAGGRPDRTARFRHSFLYQGPVGRRHDDRGRRHRPG